MRMPLVAGMIVAAALAFALGLTRTAPASHSTTFERAGGAAVRTLLHTYYAGHGRWRACSDRGCAPGNVDWGDDSLTYTLVMRARLTGDPHLRPVLRALTR